LTGAGTSAYAAAAIADGWPAARAIATTDLLLQSAEEIKRAIPSFAQGGWLISLARSGNSPESVGTVERVRELFPNVRHLAILCDESGRLAHVPNVEKICLDSRTNDRSLAMTGSFSNLVLAGLILLHGDEISERLSSICNVTRAHFSDWDRAAQEIARSQTDRVVILTSSMHALANETALKILELTGGTVETLAETCLGLRHGPISFLRSDTPVLCFASSDPHKRRYEEDLLGELKEKRLGSIAVIGDASTANWPHDFHIPAVAAEFPDFLRTPFEVPFAQLLAYRLSQASGLDPDDPSPNGLITRVVRPFRLYSTLRPSVGGPAP
jgi:tagatose-6-phosphate ketose/aldose isomerase